jgi:hypothetical protein
MGDRVPSAFKKDRLAVKAESPPIYLRWVYARLKITATGRDGRGHQGALGESVLDETER